MAEDRAAHPCAFGICLCRGVLWLARPTGKTLLLSLLLVVPGVWLRAYAAGYVRKNAELTRTGPYAYTRNPLYLGSTLIAFGFALAAGSWIIFTALAVMFAAIYLPTIRSEEVYLREHFTGFDEYARKVPRLLPRLTAAQFPGNENASRGRFSCCAVATSPRVQCSYGCRRNLSRAGGPAFSESPRGDEGSALKARGLGRNRPTSICASTALCRSLNVSHC